MLFGSLFLWQMPHFFALAWLYRKDYELGGYRMLPLTDPEGDRTSWLCLEYSVYLCLLPPACWAAGLTSCMFPLESIGFNGALLLAARRHGQSGLPPPSQWCNPSLATIFQASRRVAGEGAQLKRSPSSPLTSNRQAWRFTVV